MKFRKLIILLATITGLSIVVFNNLNQMTEFLSDNIKYFWLFVVEIITVAIYVLFNNKIIFKKH